MAGSGAPPRFRIRKYNVGSWERHEGGQAGHQEGGRGGGGGGGGGGLERYWENTRWADPSLHSVFHAR